MSKLLSFGELEIGKWYYPVFANEGADNTTLYYYQGGSKFLTERFFVETTKLYNFRTKTMIPARDVFAFVKVEK